uniref:Major facilitator superfamily (MFS) profile domain-containing protein n=1 Tax=Romanomermis culicivorax TaxID=13658 RepID=A0A915K0B4_ROMCU
MDHNLCGFNDVPLPANHFMGLVSFIYSTIGGFKLLTTDVLCEKLSMSPENQSPHKRSSVKVTLIITVLAVAFGVNGGIYNIPVANNLRPFLIEHINESRPMHWLTSGNKSLNAATLFGFVVSSFTAGSAIGTLLSPTLAECLGRRPSLLISATLNIFGSFICFFYLHIFELIFIGRLLIGMSYGLGLPLASAFIVEISPLNRRGQLNGFMQTASGVGDTLGMVVTIPGLLGSVNLSPYALSLTIISSISHFVVMCFAHESPRFLILKRNRLERAIKALKYYQS